MSLNDGKTLSDAVTYCINLCNEKEIPEGLKVAMVNLMLLSIEHTIKENNIGETILLHPTGD